MKSAEQAQAEGIPPIAIIIAEKLTQEIICANKDRWEAALQASIDATPRIKFAKHLFFAGAQEILKDIVSLCDCPAQEAK